MKAILSKMKFNNFNNLYPSSDSIPTNGDFILFLIKGNFIKDDSKLQSVNLGTIGFSGDLRRELNKSALMDLVSIMHILVDKNFNSYIDLLLNGKLFIENDDYIFTPGKNLSTKTIPLSWGKYPKLILKHNLLEQIKKSLI